MNTIHIVACGMFMNNNSYNRKYDSYSITIYGDILQIVLQTKLT